MTLFLLIFNLIHDKTYFYLHYVHDGTYLIMQKEKKSENFVKEQEYLSAKNFFFKKTNEKAKEALYEFFFKSGKASEKVFLIYKHNIINLFHVCNAIFHSPSMKKLMIILPSCFHFIKAMQLNS